MKSNIPIKKRCEWCGKDFIAYKVTTRFCCRQCNNLAYKDKFRKARVQQCENHVEQIRQREIFGDIAELQYLTPTQAARHIGIGRSTLYRYLADGDISCIQFKGKTFIRKSDIEKLFDEAKPYQKRHKKSKQPITEFYTTAEVIEKYGISESWLYQIAKTEKIPKTVQRGKSYWSKKHIDNYFERQKPDESITEWYSAAEIMEKFNMTQQAVYCFVSKFGIPKKKIKKEVLYSKRHVDIAKGIAEPEVPQYYNIKEATAKFNVTRDQLYHYVKSRNIPKIQEGKYVKISKKELDELFAPLQID